MSDITLLISTAQGHYAAPWEAGKNFALRLCTSSLFIMMGLLLPKLPDGNNGFIIPYYGPSQLGGDMLGNTISGPGKNLFELCRSNVETLTSFGTVSFRL